MDGNDVRPTVIDVYCGVGGLSLAAIQAGFQLVGGADADPNALKAYKNNFPGVPTSSANLFKASGISLKIEMGFDSIDLVVGGPPCQGFSFGGLQNQRDSRNQGVLAFARLIGELRPRFFVMENVRGFLSSKHNGKRKKFLKILQQAGYVVRSPIKVLNAADFGVPQRRLRAFVLGCREGEVLPEYPTVKKGKRVTVRAAISDLLRLDKIHTNCESDEFAGKLGRASAYSKRLRLNAKNGVFRLSGCQRTEHSAEVVARFSATMQGEQETVSRYYRLAWDDVSPTIRAGTGPEHGSYTAPRPIHPELPRCITVREAARLHSFPDWFGFHASRWHGFRQIGNSVPPRLATEVFLKIRECIAIQRGSNG